MFAEKSGEAHTLFANCLRRNLCVLYCRLLEAQKAENNNAWPETVAVVLWGTDNIKTYGESLAQVMMMVGVNPVSDPLGRVNKLEVSSSSCFVYFVGRAPSRVSFSHLISQFGPFSTCGLGVLNKKEGCGRPSQPIDGTNQIKADVVLAGK